MSSFSRSQTRQMLQIVGGIVVAMLVVVAIGTVWILNSKADRDNPETDPETLCPLEGPRSVTVIVVDKTDPVSTTTQLDIRTQLKNIVEEVPRFGLIYLYAVGTEGAATQPLFEKCSPGRADEVDDLTGSKERTQRRFEREFRGPLNEVLDDLLNIQRSPTSPIIEGVQGAAVRGFNPRQRRDLPKRLVVVSDLQQNSDLLSVYRGGAIGEQAGRAGLLAPLEDVDVSVMQILRPSSGHDPEDLRDAWKGYFSMSHAADVEVLTLTGAN